MTPTRLFGNRWKVIEQLGEGGQGWVYRVSDETDEHTEPVLLKRLKNPKRISRFQQEIDAAQRLDHRRIPKIIDSSLDDPPYFVTAYFVGPTLETDAPFPILTALEIFQQLCETVAYAHASGVVHRDLKPENVILTEDLGPVILDFGLCYFEDDDDRLTQTMEQVGSRFYMAPELESGRCTDVTDRVDSYSLGKILYFLLTGRHIAREAYTGDNNLVEVLEDAQAAYVTKKTLRVSIQEEPDARASAQELADLACDVHRLISEHFYPGTVGSVCRFCGEGTYQQAHEATLTIRTPAFLNEQVPFEYLVCDACRHVAWFFKGSQR